MILTKATQAPKIIAQFPSFTPINVDMKSAYEDWYEQFKPYSDLSFNNLVVWMNLNRDLALSRIGDTIIYRYTYPFGDPEPVFTVLGNDNLIDAAQKVFSYQDERGLKRELVMVPEEAADIMRRSGFETIEDRDNFDYIYSVEQWQNPTGRSFRSLRLSINTIRKQFEDIEALEVKLANIEDVHSIINEMHQWKSLSSLNNKTRLSFEPQAINTCLLNSEKLRVKCVALFLNGQMASLLLYHFPPQKDFVIMNHLKCDYSIDNIFDFSFFHCISNLPKEIKYFNAEQDLGIDGLRKHKSLMNPIKYLKRYRVIPG